MLDGSVTDDGELNVPCIKFVAHRHCQSALDRFFCGDYPGSKRCIPVHIGLTRILFQAVLPFLRLCVRRGYNPSAEGMRYLIP